MVMLIEFIKDTFKYILIIGILVLIRIFILTSTQVVGDSMLPSLKNGDFMFAEQVSSRLNSIKRFDIIVIKFSRPSYLIKRVIGLPGEKVKFINNDLYINDHKVEEEFKKLGNVQNFEITLAPKTYFVMGDNRDDSQDSRAFGPVEKKDIIGKVFFTLYPFNKFGFSK